MTKNRLLSLGSTLSGLNIALSYLHESRNTSFYEEYDGHEQDWKDKYGYKMKDFGILTLLFEFFYDNLRLVRRKYL